MKRRYKIKNKALQHGTTGVPLTTQPPNYAGSDAVPRATRPLITSGTDAVLADLKGLFLEKTKTHPGWNTLPETNRAVILQKLREVFPKAEQLKSELSKKFEEEYERFLKDE
ncbi:hypothetical protein J6590_102413, partial [Homalodisca vitripennis]